MENNEFNLFLLNAARTIHQADWNWKNVNSPFARIYMVESGQAKIELPDGVHIICPHHLYLVPAFVTHSYENDSTFTLYYFHVYNEYDIFSRFNFPFQVVAGELEILLVKRLLAINPGRELKRSDPRTYDNFPTLLDNINKSNKNAFNVDLETRTILQLLFLRFLNNASLKQNISDIRINKALRYIHENVEKDIYVEELSAICYLNKDYFTRLFKKEMHCTPMQYLMRKRIEKAQLLLLIGKKTIKDIAYDLSFNNIPHFCWSFKKITGKSPSDFVSQYRKNNEN